LMAQFDTVSTDSGYKGANFLASGTLSVDFGNGNSLSLTGFDATAANVNMVGTAVADASTNKWASNGNIDAATTGLDAALATLKSESSKLSSNLSVINVRQDWTTNMINTLTQGADNLTLADMNEEGANMLMLQTRQSLGTTSLSLSSQAAQSVLRLFQ
jgi:flagellin